MDARSPALIAHSNYRWSFVAAALLLSGTVDPARAAVGDTELVSVGLNGQAVLVYDASGEVSADGRYVLLNASPLNLVPGDNLRQHDVFVRDQQSGVIDWVNVTPTGAQSNGSGVYASISDDGRFVAFGSAGNDLVPGDTNGQDDIFVRDRQKDVTERVSINSNGAQANSDSTYLSISADGRFVAFQSDASNLVPGDTNGQADIFVHDRETAKTERVSVSSGEAQANESSFLVAISGDGRYVAYESYASNLISGGRTGIADIFVRDRLSGVTNRVSVNSQGTPANADSFNPSISANGRFVAFESTASNLVAGDTNSHNDIFVHDRQSGRTERVSIAWNGVQANSDSARSSISADGRRVTFHSWASNLVLRDPNRVSDVFVRDRVNKTTELVSVNSAGSQAKGRSYDSWVSANGRFVTFTSQATNLAPNDPNENQDVYIHELAAPPPPPTSALTVSPRQRTFGRQPENSTSPAQTITVTNVSDSAVAIAGVRIRGNNPGQFARTHNCGDSLAAGTHCTVNVVFKPTSPGEKSAYLLVNGGGQGLRAVYLTGVGVAATP
jgi:hypothetical protein